MELASELKENRSRGVTPGMALPGNYCTHTRMVLTQAPLGAQNYWPLSPAPALGSVDNGKASGLCLPALTLCIRLN